MLAHYIDGNTWQLNSTYFLFRCDMYEQTIKPSTYYAILPKLILHLNGEFSSVQVPE